MQILKIADRVITTLECGTYLVGFIRLSWWVQTHEMMASSRRSTFYLIERLIWNQTELPHHLPRPKRFQTKIFYASQLKIADLASSPACHLWPQIIVRHTLDKNQEDLAPCNNDGKPQHDQTDERNPSQLVLGLIAQLSHSLVPYSESLCPFPLFPLSSRNYHSRTFFDMPWPRKPLSALPSRYLIQSLQPYPIIPVRFQTPSPSIFLWCCPRQGYSNVLIAR